MRHPHRPLLGALMMAAVFACSSDDPTTPTTPSGPIAYLTFSGNASDQSGNGNDGTLMGGATAAGQLVVAGDTDYLLLPSTVMDGLGNFTFAAWLRIDTFNGDYHEILSGANAVEDNVVAFWYAEPTGEWRIRINDTDGVFPADATIEDGLWHHIALTRTGNTARLYVDGTAVGGSIAVLGDALDIDPGGLIFGQDQDVLGGGFQATDAWDGAMDNLRIYGRALSAAEIQTLAAEAH